LAGCVVEGGDGADLHGRFGGCAGCAGVVLRAPA
jgi:hypothetical protein